VHAENEDAGASLLRVSSYCHFFPGDDVQLFYMFGGVF